MRKIENVKLNFKAELSNIELWGIENMLTHFDNDNAIVGLPENIEDYGFAYTSSSSYAMYNVTNEVCIDVDDDDLPIYISHFAITENNMLIAVACDCYENYHYYEIENTDLF